MSLVLYTYPNGTRAAKALIAAEYSGVKVEVAKDFQMGVTNKTPEFLALNPNGKVPTLKTPEGAVWESNSIARYVARLGNKIYGKNALEASQIDQWLDWASGELERSAVDWIYPILGYGNAYPDAVKRAQDRVKAELALLNNYLKLRSFLVGERVSLADICVALTLVPYFATVLDATYRKAIPNVTRWYQTVTNQPNFKKVFADTPLVDKAKVPPPPKEEKAPEPKVAEKKPAAKKDEEEEESYEEPKKKGPNPLDLLPPSKFVLDEWKRVYSNEKDTRKACTWLWENLDKEGYSLWFADYKYNEELDVVFKTCNLMGGFIQRLDSLRKYGFAVLLLFGDAGNLKISGIFLVRGTEIPAELAECPDATSYDFKKVNIEDAAERKKFDDFLCWEGEFGGIGLPFNQGKTFK